MSDCKISQNMEFGDIIIWIIALLSLIFSVFNSSRKKRKEREEAARCTRTSPQHTHNEVESDDDWWLKPSTAPIPTAKMPPKPYVRKEFQSSLDLINSYDEDSSSEDAAFGKKRGRKNIYEKRRKSHTDRAVHPLLKDLLNDSGTHELKKGLIYGEILQRRY